MIGVFLRNCAELEDMFEMKLYSILKVTENQGRSLLGSTTMGTKLSKLEYAAKTKDLKFHNALMDLKSDGLTTVIARRNTLVHGTYMGTVNGDYAFLTSKPMAPEDGVGASMLETFSLAAIEGSLTASSALCKMFSGDPDIQARRVKRNKQFAQDLDLDRKQGQSKKTARAKKKPPPQSSPE